MTKANWFPTRGSSIPLHQQIYEYMKKNITNGEWVVGTKIPPQRELAKAYNVNRSTIVYALDELTADGLIQSQVGKGTFVVNNTWNVLASVPSPDWNSYVNAGAHQPNLHTIQEINRLEFEPNFIRLGTGELAPDLLPTNQMKRIFQGVTAAHLSLGYPESKGSLFLRECISEYLQTKGIKASPASIMIVSGGLQALQLISLGLLHRGSIVLHETPSYLNSINVFQSAGIQLTGIPMDENGIQIHNIGKVKRKHNASLLYSIPSFHNPTGVVMSKERRTALLDACANERLPIIEDDAYGDLWLEEIPPKPLKAYDQQGLVMYMGSMSKTLGPGLRIGWIVAPQAVVERLADIKMQTDYGSSTLSQFVVAEWLASGQYEEHLKTIRIELKQRRDYMLQLLQRYFSGIARWNIPTGGFYIWLSIQKKMSINRLFSKAIKEGILLNPGYLYDRNNQFHLRLSYSYASFNEMREGLLRLSELLKG